MDDSMVECVDSPNQGENDMMSATGRTMELKVACSHCGIVHSLLVNPDDVILWQSGSYIQDCMSYLSASERELLISRTCGTCWDNLFGSFDDEESDNEDE
jgi:hypothetical protein